MSFDQMFNMNMSYFTASLNQMSSGSTDLNYLPQNPLLSNATGLSIFHSNYVILYNQPPLYLEDSLNPYIPSSYSGYSLLFGLDQVSFDLNAYAGNVSSTVKLAQQLWCCVGWHDTLKENLLAYV